MATKIGWYTTASPFYGSRIAFFRHHDAVFKKLSKEHDVEFHVILLVQGGQQFVDRLYNGDRGVLYPTLREMNITFHIDPVHVPELDALYLDDLHTFQEVTAQGLTYTVDEQRDAIIQIIRDIIQRDKPLVFSDTDGFCTDILENTEAEMKRLYDMYHGYHKFYLISPFTNKKVYMDIGTRFKVVPFEVDPADFAPIKPKSQREFLLRYVGNEYYREHFIPVFHRLSDYGRVKINGAGWNRHRYKAPNAEWTVKVMMTPDTVNNIYGDSVLGLTGRSSHNAKKNQEIFLYRWKEYLTAGTLIVPENLPSYTSILPDGTLTVDDVLGWSNEDLYNYFSLMEDHVYEMMVTAQRNQAVQYLGVDVWLPVFKELFGIGGIDYVSYTKSERDGGSLL